MQIDNRMMARIALGILFLVFMIIAIDWNALFSETILAIQQFQHAFHEQMTSDLTSLSQNGSYQFLWGLCGIGFLYGAVHAVGPGHGKFVISSYLMANPVTLRHGILLTLLSSMLQALTAIILVAGFAGILHLTHRNADHITRWLEIASFVLVAILGIVMVWRGARSWRHAAHNHDENCGCGHAHAPSPQQFTADWKQMTAIIITIGIRPCSGAILLLLFAALAGQLWAGILATFAMAAGTALSTSFLACIAVYAKHAAFKFSHITDHKLQYVYAALGILFGLLMLVGAALFIAAQLTKAPLIATHPIFGTR